MELWQLDVVGGIELSNGTELKALTGIDDHSRFCVAAGLLERATARAVCGVFAHSLRTHGVPEEVLTDNGKVFTGRYGPRPVEVLFDRICRENGITHRLTAVRSPTTTGKIERFHRTLRDEFLAQTTFASRRQAQEALDAWINDYNTDRPHQSLGMLTPAQRFHTQIDPQHPPVPPELPQLEPDRRAPGQWVTRRVATNGTICVDCQVFSVGKHNACQLVTVHVTDTLFEIWANGALIKSVPRHRKGAVRNLRAQTRGSLSDTG
jgi:integrase-like protein